MAMINSFARLFDSACATLRCEVLALVSVEYARGRVYGVINLLNTVKAPFD